MGRRLWLQKGSHLLAGSVNATFRWTDNHIDWVGDSGTGVPANRSEVPAPGPGSESSDAELSRGVSLRGPNIALDQDPS
jgi:hypothetical protein